ncbi:MAG TPA: cytochrome c [Pyrinomonadaceae bacterium]
MSRFKNRTGIGVLLIGVCLLGGACRRDMQDQPKMKPYRGSTFFGDGLSSRPPVEGTIPRGYLRSDKALYTGKKDQTSSPGAQAGASGTALPTTGTPPGTQQSGAANAYPDDVDTFPFPITADTVKRGRERYEIFCSVCHGTTGYGDGMIVRRGFRQAASFHEDRLRQAPVGHFFDAITNGWGAMPAYASQVPVQDRWAIIAYIRALQLSQENVQRAMPSGSPVPGASPAVPGSSPQATPASGGHD